MRIMYNVYALCLKCELSVFPEAFNFNSFGFVSTIQIPKFYLHSEFIRKIPANS